MRLNRAASLAFLVLEMVRRDLKGRYAGSALGFAWAFVNPLFWVALYGLVFGKILRIPLHGEPPGVTFPEFLLAGLLPWIAVSESLTRSASALPDNAAMVKKTVFPLEALVLSIVTAALVNELIALSVFGLYLAYLRHLTLTGVALLLPALAVQALLTFGLGCLVATVTAFVRDAAHAVGLALTAVFYMVPIVYPLNLVPERLSWLRSIIVANPLTALVEWFRDVLYRRQLPSVGTVVYLTVASTLVALVGLALFARGKTHFVDLV